MTRLEPVNTMPIANYSILPENPPQLKPAFDPMTFCLGQLSNRLHPGLSRALHRPDASPIRRSRSQAMLL